MGAPRIVAVATATPPHRFDQATLLRIAGYDDALRAGFFTNSQIDGRHLYLDPETFTPDESVDEVKSAFAAAPSSWARKPFAAPSSAPAGTWPTSISSRRPRAPDASAPASTRI